MGEIAKRMAELGDPDPAVRMNAVSWLGEIHEIRAVPQITAALKDSDWRVREKAAEALGKIGGAEAVGALFGACGKADVGMCTEISMALVAIGKFGDRGIQAVARHGLGGDDAKVKMTAAWVLRTLDRPACVPYLIAGLEDSDREVMRDCANGLIALASRTGIDIPKVAESLGRRTEKEALNGRGEAADADCRGIFDRIKSAVDGAEARRSGMLSAGKLRPPAGKTAKDRQGRTAI